MEKALIQKLLDTAAVTALVGERIEPGRRDQATALPAITLHTISDIPFYANDGEAGLARARVQIDCWGETYPDAKGVAGAVSDALSAFVGTVDGTVFQNVLKTAERDLEEGGGNAAEYLFRRQMDFIVLYEN